MSGTTEAPVPEQAADSNVLLNALLIGEAAAIANARIAELEQLITMQCAAVEECAGQVTRIAELERLAREIYSAYLDVIDDATLNDDDDRSQLARWEATLAGGR